MAERKTGRQVVVILSFDKMPEGGTVNASKDEILHLLNKTQPSQIQDAGFAYEKAASAVESSMKTLEEHAGKILQVWKGADASKARHAIQMMHATGGELATKLEMMGSALRQYAGYIPETISKVEGIKAQEENSGGGTYGDAETKTAADAAAKKAAEDREAQQAMRELNKKIVDLYTLQVPHDVSYELPAVSVPGGTGTYSSTPYPKSVGGIDGGGNGGGYDTGTGGFTGSGGIGHTGGSGGTGGTGHTGGSGDHGGSTGGGNGHSGGSDGTGGTGGTGGSGHPGGSDGGTGTGTGDGSTDGQNPGGPGDPNGQTPGGPDGQTPGSHDPGSTSGSRDGTAPPVLGRDDTPSHRTEMESYQPPNTLTTPTTTGWSPTTTTYSNPFTTPTTTMVTPLNQLSPTGGTPYVPSVLGNPHGGGVGSMAGEALPAGSVRGSGSGSTGMPVAPLLGGGPGAEDGEELPRTYYLAQDWDVAGTHGLPGGVLGGQEQV
ncbi:hypothetical protein GCM10010149_86350 [Nonomuraea roseoviolacea subsp. roseoviolacea]|uniref:WXG100 family type VII secretion target n=1 Tax=Nonomuraea roseoviolacea TaxID=103837 RepID=UPI0031DC9DED